MKKKLLAMLALSAVLAMSAGLLAACNDPKDTDEPDTPCTEHVDSNNDGKCDNCGEDMGSEPVTPPEEEVKITDGVFSNQMDASHEALIKLYEDGTAYLSGFTVSYKGWYEVKEESITTAATAADGTIIDPAAEEDGKGKCEWLTFDTAIYFWADEEKTEPIVVNASAASADALPSSGIGYAYGTPVNALAYDSESDMIYNYKFDQGTRTLSHSSLRDFTPEDEAPIELYRFMLKNESDIPADAEPGAVLSDYSLIITHKGFEGNILGGSNVWNGKYVQEGNTYTLNDTFSGAEVGTLTIAEDGRTATFKNGDKTLELVAWEESTPIAAELTGTMADVVLYEDGTFALKGSISITGTYTTDAEGVVSMTFDENDFEAALTSCTNTDGTLTVNISISYSGMPLTITASGAVIGELYVPGALSLLTVSSAEAVVADMTLQLDMMSDCTLVISIAGQSRVTASWTLDAATRSISFSKTSTGELAYDWNNGQPKITWTGRVSTSETEDRTYTFSFAATDLGKLVSAKPAVTVSYTFTGTVFGGAVTLNAYLYDDNTIEIVGTSAGGENVLATGTWEQGAGLPSVTLDGENVSAKVTATSATDVKLVFHGDLGMGTAGDYELTLVR